jgi:hypothetical protein
VGVYNEAFWLLIGGAAPVIALAAVVSVRDLADAVANGWLRLGREHDLHEAKVPRFLRDASAAMEDAVDDDEFDLYAMADMSFNVRYLIAAKLLSKFDRPRRWQWVNLGVQTALLGAALFSVADHANVVPTVAGSLGAVVGLVILALVVIRAGTIQGRFEQRLQAVNEPPKTDRAQDFVVPVEEDRGTSAAADDE